MNKLIERDYIYRIVIVSSILKEFGNLFGEDTMAAKNIRLSGKCLSFANVFFYNSAPSYKRETKSVRCRGVYFNRAKWIVHNSTK